jgi:hypothetical protein
MTSAAITIDPPVDLTKLTALLNSFFVFRDGARADMTIIACHAEVQPTTRSFPKKLNDSAPLEHVLGSAARLTALG